MTDKVVLTEMRPQDSDTLFGWINDAPTVRFNAPYAPVSRPSHDRWFDGIGRDPSRIALAIRAQAQGVIVGVVQLIDIHTVHRSAELTIRIGAQENRGRGWGSQAVAGAVRFAFDDLNLQRVWLRVFATNERAIKAYRKAGFVEEGRLRRACYIEGQWQDEIVMAILRETA